MKLEIIVNCLIFVIFVFVLKTWKNKLGRIIVTILSFFYFFTAAFNSKDITGIAVCVFLSIMSLVVWNEFNKGNENKFNKGNENCCICNSNKSKKMLADGVICSNCFKRLKKYLVANPLNKMTKYNILKLSKEQETLDNRLKVFNPTKNIDNLIEIDEQNKFWRVNNLYSNVIFAYDELLNFELLQDGVSIVKGGLGSAVIGGALFGGIGAVVGGITGTKKINKKVNEFRIKIITKNDFLPQLYVNFLKTGAVNNNSLTFNLYKSQAERIITELIRINDINKSSIEKIVTENTTEIYSGADEILKYKKLLDEGIITSEEFEAKKKQILNIDDNLLDSDKKTKDFSNIITNAIKIETKLEQNSEDYKKSIENLQNLNVPFNTNDYIRIIYESLNIINESSNIDTVLSRINTAAQKAFALRQLEDAGIYKDKPKAQEFIDLIVNNEDTMIKDCIFKAFNKVVEQAEQLKTDNGKRNKISKFFDSLQSEEYSFSPDVEEYIESLKNKVM